MQSMIDRETGRNDMLINGLKGAVAGAVGVWVMDRLDWFLFRHEDQQARQRTEEIRPDGLDPAHVAVKKAARAMGTALGPGQLDSAGLAMHYALGIGPAAAYGALRERLPAPARGQDTLYGLGMGLGLFLLQDEVLNQATGLSAKQKDYPWQAHARGLVAHLTLGVVTHAVLNLLNAPRPMAGRAAATRFSSSQADDHAAMPEQGRKDMPASAAAHQAHRGHQARH